MPNKPEFEIGDIVEWNEEYVSNWSGLLDRKFGMDKWRGLFKVDGVDYYQVNAINVETKEFIHANCRCFKKVDSFTLRLREIYREEGK